MIFRVKVSKACKLMSTVQFFRFSTQIFANPFIKISPPPRSPRVYVFYYVGDGYDESDPFIDNSECFDETVPQVIKYTIT